MPQLKQIHLNIPFRSDWNGRPTVAIDSDNLTNMMIRIHPYYVENEHRYGRAYHFYRIDNGQLDRTFRYLSMDSFYPDLILNKTNYLGLRSLLDNSETDSDVTYDFICDNISSRAIFKSISKKIYSKINDHMNSIPKFCYGAVESNDRYWALIVPEEIIKLSEYPQFDEEFLSFEEYVKTHESESDSMIELSDVVLTIDEINVGYTDTSSIDNIYELIRRELEIINYGSFDEKQCHFVPKFIRVLTETYVKTFYDDARFHTPDDDVIYGIVFGRPDIGIEIIILEKPMIYEKHTQSYIQPAKNRKLSE
jgi:hypothetical protein